MQSLILVISIIADYLNYFANSLMKVYTEVNMQEFSAARSVYKQHFKQPLHIGPLETKGYSITEKLVSQSRRQQMSQFERETVWQEYTNPQGLRILLTQPGQEIIQNQTVRRAINRYEAERSRNSTRHYRIPLIVNPSGEGKLVQAGHAGEGLIYRVGSLPILAKEIYGTEYSAQERLLVMDYYRFIADRYLPNWIRVPKYYGATEIPTRYDSNNRPTEYDITILMEEIKAPSIESFFYNPDSDPKIKRELPYNMREAVKLFRSAAERHANGPLKDMVSNPDTNSSNILVDTNSPTSESPYTLWFINLYGFV